MNQGLHCKNIEVWWAIRDLIEEIQNQWSNWKRHVIVETEIDQIMAKLKVWWSIKGLNAQIRNQGPRWKWRWTLGMMLNWEGWNCMNLRVLEEITDAIKSNWKNKE